jgi:hypothetical protein
MRLTMSTLVGTLTAMAIGDASFCGSSDLSTV